MAEPPRRPNFFEGQLLSAADLAAEQDYHRQMRYLHNRLHGYGVVSGLDVGVSRGRLRVGAGLALDTCGREIVLTRRAALDLPPPPPDGRRWARDVVIAWRELPDALVPGPDGGAVPTRWVEQPEIAFVAVGRAAADAVVLARVTRVGGGPVVLDASVRRPLGLG